MSRFEAGSTVVSRNPCPNCGKSPQHLIGRLLPNADENLAYLVCWGCSVMRAIQARSMWERFCSKKASQHARRLAK